MSASGVDKCPLRTAPALPLRLQVWMFMCLWTLLMQHQQGSSASVEEALGKPCA